MTTKELAERHIEYGRDQLNDVEYTDFYHLMASLGMAYCQITRNTRRVFAQCVAEMEELDKELDKKGLK